MLMYYNLSQISLRLKKCVTKLPILTLLQYSLFLNSIRFKNDKAVNTCFLYQFQFLINIRLV